MCDRCGTIFSERAEGAATGTVTVTRRNERSGRLERVEETQDIGPECNIQEAIRPHLSIAGVAEAERLAQTLDTSAG